MMAPSTTIEAGISILLFFPDKAPRAENKAEPEGFVSHSEFQAILFAHRSSLW